MNWSEEKAKVFGLPEIGSPEWFSCVPTGEQGLARSLVSTKTPVVVQQQNDTPMTLVIFDGTEFVAAGFDDADQALCCDKVWNQNARLA